MSVRPERHKASPRRTAATLLRLCSLRPSLALVLGSGFHSLSPAMEVMAGVPYQELAGFPHTSVGGHPGRLLFAHFAGLPVLVLCGRAHYYEGYSMAEITFPIRVLAEFGVQDLLLTNAAGGINPRFRPGDFMLINDHINLMWANPLRGPLECDRLRFVDLTRAYDLELGRLLRQAGRAAGVPLRSGTYLAVSGPSYETPAEIRAFARLGADAVGMSTVPEVIAARQCGLAVAALSCITNPAAGIARRSLAHHDVLARAEEAGERAVRLLTEFAKLYAKTIQKAD